MKKYYIINEKEQVVECNNYEAWSEWIENNISSHSLWDNVGPYIIATLFTGFKNNRKDNLWSTSVSRDGQNAVLTSLSREYPTKELARAGHSQILQLIKEKMELELALFGNRKILEAFQNKIISDGNLTLPITEVHEKQP